jgi:hypothetical protein
MAERVSVEAQRAGLASRLRPLYAGLRRDEFERMVARIAEIELYAPAAQSVDLGALQAPPTRRRTTGSKSRTPITSGAADAGAQVAHHG